MDGLHLHHSISLPFFPSPGPGNKKSGGGQGLMMQEEACLHCGLRRVWPHLIPLPFSPRRSASLDASVPCPACFFLHINGGAVLRCGVVCRPNGVERETGRRNERERDAAGSQLIAVFSWGTHARTHARVASQEEWNSRYAPLSFP